MLFMGLEEFINFHVTTSYHVYKRYLWKSYRVRLRTNPQCPLAMILLRKSVQNKDATSAHCTHCVISVMFLNLNINWTNTIRLSNISWYCCNHEKQGAKFQICYYYYITIIIIIINLNITFFVQPTVNVHRGRQFRDFWVQWCCIP